MLTFGVIDHTQSYEAFYAELLAYVQQEFDTIQSGLQGDAWIWIFQDDEKVELDTFQAMQFEIKSEAESALLRSVISHIRQKYPVTLFDLPL